MQKKNYSLNGETKCDIKEESDSDVKIYSVEGIVAL